MSKTVVGVEEIEEGKTWRLFFTDGTTHDLALGEVYGPITLLTDPDGDDDTPK